MTAAVAEDLAQVPMSPFLAATLERAASYADAQSHQEVTLEHVLLALAEDPEASVILKSSDIDIARLQTDVSNFLGNLSVRQDGERSQPVRTSQELQHILEAAAEAARQGQRKEINGAILLAAIVGDGTSSAAHILRAQGLTFDATISALRNAVQPPAPSEPQPAPPPISETQAQPPQPAPPAPIEQPPPAPVGDPLADARRKVDQTLRPAAQPASAPGELSVEPKWEPAHTPASPTVDKAPPSPPPAPQPPANQTAAPHAGADQPGPGQWTPAQAPAKSDRSPTPRLQRVPPPLPPDAGLRPPRSEAGGRQDGQSPMRRDAEPAWTQSPAQGQPAPASPPARQDRGRSTSAAPVPPWIGETAVRQPGRPVGAPGEVQRPATTPLQPRSTQIKVETGQLVENIPRKMKAGITQLVEVRIARANVKALAQGLQGGGTAVRHDALITKAMSVKLRAPDGGFWVEAASPETQWIDNVLGVMTDDYASWRWSVTPKAAGHKKLQLVVSARTVGSDGLAAETALPDQLYTVKVAVNYKRSAKRATGWLLAAVFGGVLARFGEDAFQALKSVIANGGFG